jgi:hypothetical protein
VSASVFEQTARHYLDEIKNLDFTRIEAFLGVKGEEKSVTVPLFGLPYKATSTGILDHQGNLAPFDRAVIIFKYLLLCPKSLPKEAEWITYRNFKDSGPLTKYFEYEVERAIASFFSGKLEALLAATQRLGGVASPLALPYDHAAVWLALPKIPVMLLFNDADETFPAKCTVLFKDSAESYLDCECLAMIGKLLFIHLSSV